MRNGNDSTLPPCCQPAAEGKDARKANPAAEGGVLPATINDGLRAIAGFFVLLSVVLAIVLNDQRFLYFTLFVGLNLLQSAFSKWCPMITFLRKLRVREG